MKPDRGRAILVSRPKPSTANRSAAADSLVAENGCPTDRRSTKPRASRSRTDRADTSLNPEPAVGVLRIHGEIYTRCFGASKTKTSHRRILVLQSSRQAPLLRGMLTQAAYAFARSSSGFRRRQSVSGVIVCSVWYVVSLDTRESVFSHFGWVAEWFKAPVLKTGVGESPPWVRIPPHPSGHMYSELKNRNPR
jgi:hypothetical protein